MTQTPNGANAGRNRNWGHSRGSKNILNPTELMEQLYGVLSMSTSMIDLDFHTEHVGNELVSAVDGTATLFAVTAGESGIATATTGTTDNGLVGFNTLANWLGDQNCGMEVRLQLDVVTGFALEVGFTDPLTDETLLAVDDVDTPTIGNGATDVAVYVLDTDSTLQTAKFVSKGTSIDIQGTELGTHVPTAATYLTIRVQLRGNDAEVIIFDENGLPVRNGVVDLTASHVATIEGGTALRAHLLVGTRNTTAKVPTVDYVKVWQDRV